MVLRLGPANDLSYPVVRRRWWPALGHTPLMSGRQVDWLQQLRDEHGRFCWLDTGAMSSGWTLYSLDSDDHKLLNHNAFTIEPYAEMAPILLGRSLLTQDDPVHKRMRSALNRPFTPRGLTAAGVGSLIREVVQRRCRELVRKDRPVIIEETRELALDIIFRILGIPTTELSSWRHQYERILLSTIPVPEVIPGSPRSRAARARRWLCERLMERITIVREQGGEGLLAEMVRDWDEGHEIGSEDGPLLDNVLLLAVAGHETTASTMAWMVLTLAHQPELFDALVHEVDHMAAFPERPDNMGGVPLATGLFREALRMYPPLPMVARQAKEEVDVGDGSVIPPGVLVTFPTGLWSRDPALFDAPNEFRPQRWHDRKVGSLERIGFGNGAHFCLGYHVAWVESVQFAVALAQALREVGKRPAPVRAFPTPWYFGLATPPKRGTVVQFAQA